MPQVNDMSAIAPSPLAITLSNVTLALGSQTILKEVSLQIHQGEFVGVLGPNGAGKTTLIRALLGLIKPVHGTLTVGNHPAGHTSISIGYLPQARHTSSSAHSFSSKLSGREFMASSLEGHQYGWGWLVGKNKAHQQQAIEEALALVDASELASRPLGRLSGGERQRVLLAQCLLGKPDLLLLDEPLIHLDPHHQASVIELIHRVQRQLNIAVLLCAHEINPLLGVIDRVLYLGRGQAALGTVDEVINAPVLSRLYGSTIDVLRINGRIFVMSGNTEAEAGSHDHPA